MWTSFEKNRVLMKSTAVINNEIIIGVKKSVHICVYVI